MEHGELKTSNAFGLNQPSPRQNVACDFNSTEDNPRQFSVTIRMKTPDEFHRMIRFVTCTEFDDAIVGRNTGQE